MLAHNHNNTQVCLREDSAACGDYNHHLTSLLEGLAGGSPRWKRKSPTTAGPPSLRRAHGLVAAGDLACRSEHVSRLSCGEGLRRH